MNTKWMPLEGWIAQWNWDYLRFGSCRLLRLHRRTNFYSLFAATKIAFVYQAFKPSCRKLAGAPVSSDYQYARGDKILLLAQTQLLYFKIMPAKLPVRTNSCKLNRTRPRKLKATTSDTQADAPILIQYVYIFIYRHFALENIVFHSEQIQLDVLINFGNLGMWNYSGNYNETLESSKFHKESHQFENH